MTFESLYSQYEALLGEHTDLKSRYQHCETYIERLEEMVRLLRHRKFAPRSEKMPDDDEQVDLFNEIEAEAAGEPAADESEQLEIEVGPYKRKKPKRKKLPKDLPREEVVIELPENERFCPHDGTPLKVVGEEVSEQLDVIPMQMKIIATIRRTYGCPCCETFMKTAPVQPQAIPKGIPTAGTCAFIATSKFCDGLSLYHIEKMFERNGIQISRGSMAHWMIRLTGLAQPVINLMNEDLLSSDYVQMDETVTQVLKEKGKKPQTKSYMWVRARPVEKPIVIFDYDPSRSGKVAERLMSEFQGRLQCDGFGGYNELEKNPKIIRHGCFAHARRKFYEAVKSQKGAKIAKHALKLIRKLYRIEDDVRGKPPDEIFRVRQEQSKPILEELREWIATNLRKVPPKCPTGKALSYLYNEWSYISRYIDDGRVHIDNNFIENKIRPFAVGRKRWLFSDTVAGAEASAALYSLVETAKANGLEPYRYLRHLFERLPFAKELPDFEALLPWNVKF
jgi:transposase